MLLELHVKLIEAFRANGETMKRLAEVKNQIDMINGQSLTPDQKLEARGIIDETFDLSRRITDLAKEVIL